MKISSLIRKTAGYLGDIMKANELFKSINWSRKESDIREVKEISFNAGQEEFLSKLEKFDVKDITVNGKFDGEFLNPMPKYFIVEDQNLQALVNTEGYDYIRYAVRIPKNLYKQATIPTIPIVPIQELNGRKAITNIQSFLDGEIAVGVKDRSYIAKRPIKSLDLHKGMLFAGFYNTLNQGFDVYEFLGISGNDEKYGKGGVKYSNIRECLIANKVTSLKALEESDGKNEYGKSHFMWVRDLEMNDTGPWFYLFEGKWSRGSGADALRFVEVERV